MNTRTRLRAHRQAPTARGRAVEAGPPTPPQTHAGPPTPAQTHAGQLRHTCRRSAAGHAKTGATHTCLSRRRLRHTGAIHGCHTHAKYCRRVPHTVSRGFKARCITRVTHAWYHRRVHTQCDRMAMQTVKSNTRQTGRQPIHVRGASAATHGAERGARLVDWCGVSAAEPLTST